MISSRFWAAITPLACSLGLIPSVLAQSITPAPDGTGTIVSTDGQTYTIQGGTQAGFNLFHSFQDFGLTIGEIADFLSSPSISNIFGRVVGGAPSIIDGLIQVSGSSANLYLMNPAGILFGANAQLNVSGDFFATTAEQICFATGCFNSVGMNDYGALLGSPTTLGFLNAQPGSLVNLGHLEVAKGKSIHLGGGTVVNLGQVVAPGGSATIAAIPGDRQVRLSTPGSLLSLEMTNEVLADGIDPLTLPELLTAAAVDVGGKAIAPGDVMLGGMVEATQVDLHAAGQVTPTQPALVKGKTRVTRFSSTGENPDQAVFIDARADNPEDLLYGTEAGTVTQIIGREEDGIAVVTEQLAAISGAVGSLDSVAIVAEGNQGNFWLGNQWIRSETIGDYSAQLQTWGASLTTNADLLLYSCFTALGTTGEALVASIASITGADVAASTNATSSANYGGDWQLEHQTGAIEADNPFTTETLTNWEGKLATRTVTTLNNTGTGSLREAIQSIALDGDLVVFSVRGTINLDGTTSGVDGEITWSTNNLTVDGDSNITINGDGNSRIFNISANNATIQDLTIRNGSNVGNGGGIYHNGAGVLTIENATISANTTTSPGSGGGVFTNGSITLVNSTVSDNSAQDNGGGVYSIGAVTLTSSTVSRNSTISNGGGIFSYDNVTLINSTVSSNSAQGSGGGIRSDIVTATNATIAFNAADSDNNGTGYGGGLSIATIANNTIHNTIIANNSDNGAAPDIAGSLLNSSVQNSLITNTTGISSLNLSNGVNGNIIGQDPQLGPLQNNGGSTQTHALGASSPAINAGNNSLAVDTNGVSLTVDQAGNLRIFNGTVDIGAYEYQDVAVTITPPTCDVSCTPQESITLSTPDSTEQETIDIGIAEADSQIASDYAGLNEQIAAEPLSIAQIQQILGDIEAQTGARPALVYFTFVPSTLDNPAESASDPQEHLIASSIAKQLQDFTVAQGNSPLNQDDALQLILVTPQGTPIVKRPAGITRRQVASQVRRLRRGVNAAGSDRYLQPAQHLYDWLIRPLQPNLSTLGISNLSVIAEEGVRSLPLAALHDGDRFLVEQYSLAQIPSLSLIDWRYRPLHNATILAMGASEFPTQTSLPAVPTELQLITARPMGQSYLNEQFTHQNLKTSAARRDFQILHLATHARFQAGAADQAYIQLWGDDRIQLNSLQEFKFHTDPAIELLVLSACETAVGDAKTELGFAGASLQAGVKSVLASLWQVSDLGTLVLMTEFYRQLANPQVTIKAEALRQAQLMLLNGQANWQQSVLENATLPPELVHYQNTELSHPYYWSGFTLVGNPW
ncbi:MAG: CHAT domain-containing protein [Spirulina sp. SIO3F2]|nr:CHAT domain-containing protein [Spirulina sp. SIO3F2]